MSERLEQVFQGSPRGLTRLVAYVMAGDPSYEMSLRRLRGLAASGVDVLELGVPFSDPMADGPIIQAAGERALAGGMTLSKVLRLVREFRREATTPLLLMSYLNPLLRYGWDQFVLDAVESGVDGLILPDLPWREGQALRERTAERVGNRLTFIPMVAQTSEEEDIQALQDEKRGFVYVLSRNGITGGEAEMPAQVRAYIAKLHEMLSLPRCVGFGIQKREQVEVLAGICEGVIVGSALVDRLAHLDAAGLEGEGLRTKEAKVYTWLAGLKA
ncbi:MAG: tryptophan synthase subunit alpha [Desulfitobacteriaceae bacterium]|nr:tryptophan synthase subunit alpha [Desulfitobacteriaceae bacterium]MDI6913556.1 tryptophan synthase subunit alpha [Desulfitobacteriaceae bacterium]